MLDAYIIDRIRRQRERASGQERVQLPVPGVEPLAPGQGPSGPGAGITGPGDVGPARPPPGREGGNEPSSGEERGSTVIDFHM